ncbi:unnamed protein product [Hermetia illucens]|uniref:Reverse transcriptase domain-containing protein n=1 Tax=Hermetia illucens TaxID=343691 RepID=A0A7R8YKS4_HERIL|nr:unnamed protein product [Hermetia illucens]
MKRRVVSYVDEIIIPSKNIKEGLEALDEFLGILAEFGMTLNIKKCTFLATEVSFLGHRITKEGLLPGEVKTDAIQKFPTPSNRTEVRLFLGLTSFFRRFVQGYAQIALPLTRLLKTKDAFDTGSIRYLTKSSLSSTDFRDLRRHEARSPHGREFEWNCWSVTSRERQRVKTCHVLQSEVLGDRSEISQS